MPSGLLYNHGCHGIGLIVEGHRQQLMNDAGVVVLVCMWWFCW